MVGAGPVVVGCRIGTSFTAVPPTTSPTTVTWAYPVPVPAEAVTVSTFLAGPDRYRRGERAVRSRGRGNLRWRRGGRVGVRGLDNHFRARRRGPRDGGGGGFDRAPVWRRGQRNGQAAGGACRR